MSDVEDEQPAVYPKVLVVPPLQLPHKQSVIILHGRGSTARAFGPELLIQQPLGHLDDESSRSLTLQQLLLNAAFIFPTAAPRRARLFTRAVIHQWFDSYKLTAPNDRPEWMVEGLRESTAFIQELVKQEIQKVGSANVVLGGLSQGCATVLAAMVLASGAADSAETAAHESQPAAYFGMCGWLPFAEMIDEELDAHERDDDTFEKGSSTSAAQIALGKVRELLRTELTIPTPKNEREIMRPVFLGHGVLDFTVSVRLGREASDCLARMGVNIQWKEYESLGHWYSDEMLHDILCFIEEKAGWDIEGLQAPGS